MVIVVPNYKKIEEMFLLIDTTLKNTFSKTFFSAWMCRLDCHPGYVARQKPILTCVDGKYHPHDRL